MYVGYIIFPRAERGFSCLFLSERTALRAPVCLVPGSNQGLALFVLQSRFGDKFSGFSQDGTLVVSGLIIRGVFLHGRCMIL